MEIGTSLKKIRLSLSYTLVEVSRRLKISASLLSQIEKDKVLPSFHTLEHLLELYSVSFSDFFRQVEQINYIYIKKSDSEKINYHGQRVLLTLLASKLKNNMLESYLVQIGSGGGISVAQLPRAYEGERFIYNISGSIAVNIDSGETILMSEGDSLNFKCQVACSIQNLSGMAAQFLITGIPPVF